MLPDLRYVNIYFTLAGLLMRRKIRELYQQFLRSLRIGNNFTLNRNPSHYLN